MSDAYRTCPRCGGTAVRADEIRWGATCPNCLATVEVNSAAVVLFSVALLLGAVVPFQMDSPAGFLSLGVCAFFVARQEWLTTRYFPLKVYDR